ncbi:adenylate/guanylate cyclase domain-containing protein [Mycobacterium sp. E796]|uniref:ATP-binding protein n=1 Tax=Mycobacterium sp. E796 TaxID=1834151 RepID=UPI0007FFE493|nr:adenylate/guanylate cyclase domain-containing protein [Mycobacterium sp. E796]OBI47060.1 cyclase [Mycobacterium sp. E796]
MAAAASTCATCEIELREGARFCDGCGSPITPQQSAEYKQVTVLFADVVGSMDIAEAVGAERLREIMADLFDRCAAIVDRYAGTVDKFTGDGIMAVFGAPIALEDHALCSCLAALDIQDAVQELAGQVQSRDGIHLQLRVGLNSGEVIAGDVGSNPWNYTAVGLQVGMAQRMESVAPPGGVMLSESTARLVDDVAALGTPENVLLKGVEDPVVAWPLLSMRTGRFHYSRRVSKLVGRGWELATLTALLDRSVAGRGCVVSVVGPVGIGKSRVVDEIVAVAIPRLIRVFSTYCESHTGEVPFLVVERLMRAAFGVEDMSDHEARALLRDRVPAADHADQVLLEDTLGIRDPDDELPDIAPDARRRRLTALVCDAALASAAPTVYVIEDAHWIDPSSESLLADFISVVPRTHSLVLITYRPEYAGALSQLAGAQKISLAPLTFSDTKALVVQLLGTDPSVAGLVERIAERAAGNPFFVEEIVRDLTDRNVLQGAPGAYLNASGSTDVAVPATLQAAIAARIDRLDGATKATLNAAAVIGVRFRADLLAALADCSTLDHLVHAHLIEQVNFTPVAEYAFRQPLIQTVAYRSQLKAGRAALHTRLAATLAERDPGSVDENAALIAEHLEAAGDLAAAFGWHMRAGTWLTRRDIRAARMSWQRACHVADRLPGDQPGRAAMQIAPRALLCLSAWRFGGRVDDTIFDELHGLATAADDKASLAMGMAGQIMALNTYGHYRQAAAMVTEFVNLLDSLGDPVLSVTLRPGALTAKFGAGELAEVVRLADRIIDEARADPQNADTIVGSSLGIATMMRAAARMCWGATRWRQDVDHAVALGDEIEPGTRSIMLLHIYGIGVVNGLLVPDAAMLSESEQALRAAEERGDQFALAWARFLRGLILVQLDGAHRAQGFDLLAQSQVTGSHDRLNQAALQQLKVERAKEQARAGDLDNAIAQLRAVVEAHSATDPTTFHAAATAAFVETLLQRGRPEDLDEAAGAVDRLAALPTEPGFVLFDVALLRLRALLARARGEDAAYHDFAERYRAMSTSFGFEGHMAAAQVLLERNA